MPERKKYQSVEEYFKYFEGETLQRLKKIQAIIKKLAPDSTERISYNIPASFLEKGLIVYYSGYERHVSLYPGRINENIDKKFLPYVSGKSTLKFPNDQPFPEDLIKQYVAGRIALLKEEK